MRFQVLGAVQARGRGGAVTGLRPRQRALLAYLLLHADRMVPVANLVEAVWGGEAPATARNQVQSDVSAIRRQLAAAGMADPVTTGSGGYRFNAGDAVVDVAEFRAGVQRGLEAAGGPAAAAEELRAALALWRGEPLADVDAAFVEGFRVSLTELRLRALEALADAEIARGRPADVVAELADLVGRHPVREGLVRRLMTALYRSGRQAEALAAARRLRRTLLEEHGLEPGREVRELEAAILRSAADPLDQQNPDTVGHRAPSQLPVRAPDFVGRTEALRRLDAAAAAPDGPVVVISGGGGVGKTALAVLWAHRNRSLFPDGRLFVDLRGFDDGEPMPPYRALAGLLQGLGVPSQEIPLDADGLAAEYRTRTAGRSLLVVLDNARDAEQVRPLLPAGSGCLTVVTSRGPLAGLTVREGAARIPLDALPLGDSVSLLERLIGRARVAAEPGAVADLSVACGRLPLALRIAAAVLAAQPGRSIGVLAAELSGSAAALAASDASDASDSSGAPAVSDDFRTAIGPVLDTSYRLLPTGTQRVFRLLGLIPGDDFGPEAVAALAGVSRQRAEYVLAALVDVGLVEAGPVDVGLVERSDRFRLHDLVRDYTREKRSAEDPPQTLAIRRAALFDWYQASVSSAAAVIAPNMIRLPAAAPAGSAGVPGFTTADEALAWLDAERSSLVAAVQTATATGHERAAWMLADGLRGYFYLRMRAVDWVSCAQAAVAAGSRAPDAERDHVLAMAMLSLGMAHHSFGEPGRARRYFTHALRHARQAGWAPAESAASGNLGLIAWRAGDLELAAALLRDAVELARRSGDAALTASQLGNLATVTGTMGRLSEASEQFTEIARLMQSLGHTVSEAHALANLCHIKTLMGDAAAAEKHGLRSRELFDSVGDSWAAYAMAQVALARLESGDPAGAVQIAEAGLVLAREKGNAFTEVDALAALVQAEAARGEPEAALDAAERALAAAARLGGSPEYAANAHLAAATAYAAAGRWDDAESHIERALQKAESGRLASAQADARFAAARVRAARGDVEGARESAEAALRSFRESGRVPAAARAEHLLVTLEA